MNNKSQRIAIAEACGISQIRMSGKWEVTDPPENSQVLVGMNKHGIVTVPDYLNDLNAMHEAEKVLTGKQQIQWFWHIRQVLNVPGCRLDAFTVAHATAAQRAEAFVRALELWKD